MPEERGIGPSPNSDNTPLSKGKNWLLVIGIDEYADVFVPKLVNAVRDTERLTKILTEKYGFHVFCTLHDEKATRSAVLDAIEELEKLLKPQDNLIIFFSGHGYRKSRSGFIVPFDGRNDRTTDYISFVDLNARIDELPMHHFLFILDCCFAGVALKNLGEKRELGKPSRRILAASGSDETAEDGFYGRNSPFTSALAEILEDNKGSELPVKNLHVQLRDLMDAKGVRQVPVEGSWKMESNRDGEFIFLKKDLEVEAWSAVDKNKKADLQAFVKKHPHSKNVAEANLLIQAIEAKEAEIQRKADAKRKAEAEEQACNRALANPTIYNLNLFLKNYPLSIHSESIEKRLAEAEEEAAWKEAKNQNSITAYRGFIRRYPQSGLTTEAYKRIEAIEAALEAEELKRQNAHNEEAKRIQAADKAAKDKQEGVEKQKAEEKAEKERREKAAAESIRQARLAKEAADKKAKEEQSKSRLLDDITVEPSFFQKFKMPLVGVGLFLVAFSIWLAVPKTTGTDEYRKTNEYQKVNESTPSVSEPQKPVFDNQKFENLLKDADGAIEAEDFETAKQKINEAKSMSPNDARIGKYEARLPKAKK